MDALDQLVRTWDFRTCLYFLSAHFVIYYIND